MGIFSLFLILLMSSVTFASDCDVEIKKTMWPVQNSVVHTDLCLGSYFQQIDIANYSQNEESGKTFKDPKQIQYYDMFLFDYPTPMGAEGRLDLVKQIYNTALKSLHQDLHQCELLLYDGQKQLTLENFIFYKREANGQPGSRLMLTFEDVKEPHWKLVCTDQNAQKYVKKSGDYFFIFVDVYENLGTSKLPHHLSKYLFSLR